MQATAGQDFSRISDERRTGSHLCQSLIGLTGTILSGTLSQEDSLVLLPSGIETRTRSLETHHKQVEQAYAGQRVGMNLHRVPVEQVTRGMFLAAPGLLNPGFLLNVDLKLLKTAKAPIRNRQRVKNPVLPLGASSKEKAILAIHPLPLGRAPALLRPPQ